MVCKCIENSHGNTNFTVGKEYEMTKASRRENDFGCIRTDFGGLFTAFQAYNKPKSYETGSVFEFALCKFEIL